MDCEHYKGNLISTLFECVFYGIFLTLFIISTSLLAFRWNQSTLATEKRLRVSLLGYLSLGFMMFLCLTGVLVFTWMRFLSPNSLDTTTGSGLFLYFGVGDESITPAIFGRGVLFVATSKFSDMILTYRLWVIFGGSLPVMVVPYLIWVGYFVSCTGIAVNYIIHEIISSSWILSFITLSICLNVYFTGSVFYHLNGARKVVSYGGANTSRALAIMIESAAVYTIWLLLLVITILAHAEDIASNLADGVAPVAGIVTMLVNVRVGLGWDWGGPSTPSPPNSPGTAIDFERWCSNVSLTSASERNN